MAAPGNVLELYEDRPTNFEAWDLDPFHLETRATARRPPGRDRPGGAAARRARFERPAGARSTCASACGWTRRARRLEFHCEIDWREDRRALRVRFPVAVLAPRATYEMQFGVVERPTHASTRRDLAQYEVPGHRFADLSEHGFGVALLSAATYGWSVLGGEMRMTLLRSPRWPDPHADVGEHALRVRHLAARGELAGGRRDGGGARFNAPLLLGPGVAARARCPPTTRRS